MQLEPMLTSIAILAIMAGIGAYATKFIRFQADVKKAFITLIVQITMPCIILNSLFRLSIDNRLLSQMAIIFAISVLVNCLGIAMGWLGGGLLKVSSRRRREIAILAGLGNTATMGIPICAALFGAEGALLAAVFDSGVDVVIWTVAVVLLQEKPKFTFNQFKTLLNMPILAILIGLAVTWTKLPVPPFFEKLTGTLSQATVPLAMIYIGMLLATTFDIKKIYGHIRSLWNPFLIKLVVFPCTVIVLLSLIPVQSAISEVILIQVSMPSLALASIIFAYCSADEELASVTTAYSTILSSLTVPAIVLLGGVVLQLQGIK